MIFIKTLLKKMAMPFLTEFLLRDTLLSVIILIIFVYYMKDSALEIGLVKYLMLNGKDLYQTLASICGTLLGFITTTFAIVVGYIYSDKFKKFRADKKAFQGFQNAWLSTIVTLTGITVFSLFGLATGGISYKLIVFYSIFILSIITLFRLYTCLKMFKLILDVMSKL